MSGHLISRPAYATACPHCGSRVLIAIDGGLTITTSIHVLNIHAEIAARLTGLITYDLISEPGRKTYLVSRDIFRVRATRGYPVVATHICPDRTRPALTWRPPDDRGYAPKTAAAVTYNPERQVPF